MNDDYDSPWKDMIELYFPQFMAFFFPSAYRDVDWSKGFESHDKELRRVVRDAISGNRSADKLIKVWLLNGRSRIVFVHIEVQVTEEAAFEERMFQYNYRLFDRYRTPIVSLAILGDGRANWRPKHFGWDQWGCRMGLEFPAIKLLDYNKQWSDLEANDNLFVTVITAHLETHATRHDPEGRLSSKTKLVRRLYRRGYTRQDILELFRIIDWMLVLPPELERVFEAGHADFEARMNMRYVTSVERNGMQRGMAALLARQLKQRFGHLPPWVSARLGRADSSQLEAWADRIFDAPNLEALLGPQSSES